jgi:hypothetical protein
LLIRVRYGKAAGWAVELALHLERIIHTVHDGDNENS